MSLFFAILLAVVVLLHFYIGRRLIPSPRFGTGGRWLACLLLIASALSIPLTFLAGRQLEPGFVTTALAWYGFTNFGLMGIFAALVFARDLFLVSARLAPKGNDPSRREFLRRASTFGVLGVGAAITAEGAYRAQRPPVLERVRVPIDDLPEALDGFVIAQISDTHLGPTLGRDFLEDVVRRTNAEQPDLIALTGDLADGFVEHMRDTVEPLRDLNAKHGTYFVTGNHEYYWRAAEWTTHIRELGIHVLLNGHKLLRIDGATLAIGGVPDIRESTRPNSGGYAPDAAFAGAEDADCKVMLAHQPKSLFDSQRVGAHLHLCGHTHGGQVFPMNLLVHLAHPIVSGLRRFGDTWVYVNRGTAYWGPPLRTGSSGEITLVTLTRA